MPAASITTTAGPAFRVPVGAFGFRVRNLSDTTIYWRDSADVATSGDTMGMPLDPGQEHVEVYDKDNKNPRAILMVHGGSGSKSIVYDFLQVQLQAISGSPVAATVTINPGDIEIGAVEPKDADTDNRANIKAANTPRTTATNVLAVQHVDANGAVLNQGTATSPSSGVTTVQPPAVTQVISTALEASHVLKASAGQLISLAIFNSKASAQFILILNSATLTADGPVTLLYPPIPIAANSIVVLDLPRPVVASNGITVCNSSTGSFTKTIGSADCAFHAQIN